MRVIGLNIEFSILKEINMKKVLKTAVACLAFVAVQSMATDYMFPSHNPPANLNPANVNQYVTFIFDDNSYSGKKATQYEDSTGEIYGTSSFVGGVTPWGTANNKLNLQEGDMGMSWAAYKLAGFAPLAFTPYSSALQYPGGTQVSYNGNIYTVRYYADIGVLPTDTANWTLVGPIPTPTSTKLNPDGKSIHFTFNVITGMMVPVQHIVSDDPNTGWQDMTSKFGYWTPNKALDYPDGTPSTEEANRIARAWGREQQALNVAGTEIQQSYITTEYTETYNLGHEIGNHTIDHMESNSPLPGGKDSTASMGFARWGNEGFDSAPLDTAPWGEVFNEATQFGQKVGASAQTMGWKMFAGQSISANAWGGAISLAEAQLDTYMNVSVAKGNLHAFRAPRLEVNSGLYYALNNLHYEYDCGIEEGYEDYVDGSNDIWPYTVGNGIPGSIPLKQNGEHVYLDSMPDGSGVWEIPVNAIVVPPSLREQIWIKHAQITSNSVDRWNPIADSVTEHDEFIAYGRITAFDFNLFILYGMDKNEFVTTMEYNLDQRMAHNKAPLQYGCHTDYYTPIYDNATLKNSFNKGSYGLVISQGWNTWKDRQDAVSTFLDYCISKKAYVVSGHELITAMKALQAQDNLGTKVTLTSAKWDFFGTASTSQQTTFTGDITGANVTVAGGLDEECGYAFAVPAGTLTKLDHISLTYQSNHPIKLALVDNTGKSWSTILNNCGPVTHSGNIPLSAFAIADSGVTGTLNVDSIAGIQIQVVNLKDSGTSAATLNVSEFSIYTNAPNDVVNRLSAKTPSLSLNHVNSSSLTFNAPLAGRYSIKVYELNGRMVQSVASSVGKAGVTTVGFTNRLAPAMYLVKISGASNCEMSRKAIISGI